MGTDIHIAIQVYDQGDWQEVAWQREPYTFPGARQAVPDIPVAPEGFDDRNYNLFGLIGNVRNGYGFAGCKTGEGWPTIAAERGLPTGVDEEKLAPNPQSWLYGIVQADVYEKLAPTHGRPKEYSGGISGPGIRVYDPDEYKEAKAAGTLSPRPYVRMGWPMTARDATRDWPGKVLPWLKELAAGKPLRLVIGFDS